MGGMDMGDDSSASPSAAASAAPASNAVPTTAPGAFDDADVMFAQGMIAHCQQALDMAALAPDRASDKEVKDLATKTTAEETGEITGVKAWLKAWNRPESAGDDMGGMDMGGDNDMSGMDMGGSASDADMKKLKAAKGGDFDRMYLQMMIAHRKGEISMAKDEQSKGRNGTAKELAATMAAEQTSEAATMQKLLGTL
jgi:uncharacterized protein (DUF305 family)